MTKSSSPGLGRRGATALLAAASLLIAVPTAAQGDPADANGRQAPRADAGTGDAPATSQPAGAPAADATADLEPADTTEPVAPFGEQAAQRQRTRALEAERTARTEAARVIAAERARLAQVRLAQARRLFQLALEEASLAHKRSELESFRGAIAARRAALALRKTSSGTSDYDDLYARTVEKLKQLRPQAVEMLWLALRGVPDAPRPGPRPAQLGRLQDSAELNALTRERADLDRRASAIEARHAALVQARLALLHHEVTWLNDHRTALFAHLSESTRRNLLGPTQATAAQLTREITQLVFDVVYWGYTRLRQVHEIPALAIDVFPVGNLLWKAFEVLLLLLLLRFTLRRWQPWMRSVVRQISRSANLGHSAVRLAKLADAARHAGRPALVLLVAWLLYRVVGADRAPVEVRVIYRVVFWLAIYRIQLRLVETLARHIGLERALRAAAGEELLEQEEELEGPPAPRAVRITRELGFDDDGGARVVPASVLVVRSVRATTRYVLFVVLLLELTAVAVGRGTIYGLTKRFYWWASLPFVIYFLQLWRPHIIGAYQRLGGGAREGALGRLVQRSERRFYGVFVVAAAFVVVAADRVANLARRYLRSRDATKRLLAYLFRRRIAKQAEQAGRIVVRRQELPQVLLDQFPTAAIDRAQGAFDPPVMEEIASIYATWQSERADGAMALIGATGMGKSTIVRLLEDALGCSVVRGRPGSKLVRANQVVSWLAEVMGYSPRPTSETELIRAIRADTRPVVALDDCHDLFLRRVGGFEGWDALVRIVNETCDNTFWLATFNATAWAYLFNAAGRVHYFRRVVQIAPWSERRIQRLLMYRTRRARLRTSFSDLVAAQLPDLDPTAEAGRTSAGYFRMLWDFTGGNPRLASQFWLDSLVPDPDQQGVRVNLFKEPAIEELDQLAPDIAFVLTAVAAHENLSAEETARTTGLSLDFCRFACRTCLEDGYLTRDPPNRLRLSVRWQRPVLRFLRRKHLLHDES